ncbi:MAG TPA: phosphoribosyltransferase family protein [Acetobacteraceae bacterium]
MWFLDRHEAGRHLAKQLLPLRQLNPVVLALPPSGVPVGLEIAQALDADFDLVLTERITAPGEPDVFVGAVGAAAEPQLVIDAPCIRRLDLPMDYVAEAATAAQTRLECRRRRYFGDRPLTEVTGRTVIVVDDGVGLFITTRAALRAVESMRPARLILAVPVAPIEALEALEQEAHEVVCLGTAEGFMSVGQFYRQFPCVQDAEVAALLEETRGVAR